MADAPKEVLEEVEREYEKTLVVPAEKPSPQWMLMPVGLIGSGKTTVVKALAEHFGLIRISTDEVRKLLKDRSYSYEGCRDIVLNLGQKYLTLGYSLTLDANTGSTAGLEYNARLKESFPHMRQIFIHIDPPEEFIIEKLKERDPGPVFKDSKDAIERYFINKNAFTLPNLPFTYRFDTSKDNMPEQLEEGVKAIEKALQS